MNKIINNNNSNDDMKIWAGGVRYTLCNKIKWDSYEQHGFDCILIWEWHVSL